MPPQGQGQGGEADNSLAALWIIGGIFLFLGFIWYFFSDYIVAFVLTIRSWEISLIKLVIPDQWTGGLDSARAMIHTAEATQFKQTTFGQVQTISSSVGWYLRFPTIIIMCILAILLYKQDVISQFKKTYSMKKLRDAEVQNWPQIMPIVKLDLVHEDLDQGAWAMSMTPMQFAKKNNLLLIEKITKPDFKSRGGHNATLNREEARRIFSMQLGAFWQDSQALPIHARALFAVFAARMAGDRDEPAKLLAQISRSSLTGKLNFSGADNLLKKHANLKQVQTIISKHAYVYTVMASMIEQSREDGVVPTSDFLWLKPLDRKLWYVLNTVGRQTPFVEIAGVFAHWVAEKEFSHRLNVPMIEEAVNGLAEAIKEVIYKHEE
jgi:intracellular multiplication protein IcmP